ncbi:MAG: acylneuraminate cytidylyltransferase family protein [Legionella sp.]|nr:acylneuraminate cytidylyltransferase family protein [Legionella sp.]
MYNGKTFLAIIPARGGSKRLPRKNVLDLGGKPLIAWTIEAALGCPFLDEVLVTTDDEEIAEVAKRYGANVPFLRPPELASDTAISFDVIKHAINFYKIERGKEFDFVMLLQPTSPFRSTQNISEAIELRVEKNADAIISVCEVEHSPLWMNTLPADHSMAKFIREDVKNKRSQELNTFYRLNGAIYLCNIKVLLEKKSFFTDYAIYAYLMSLECSVDIDTNMDLLLAISIVQNNTRIWQYY